MTYIFNENFRKWRELVDIELPKFTPTSVDDKKKYDEDLRKFWSQKASTRGKCPFCEKLLSYCSMDGHVYNFHSKPNKTKRDERTDKLPMEVKQERRQLYLQKYREEKGDELREKKREAYHQNRDKYLEKYICECGVEGLRRDKNRHEKSKRHQQFIESKNQK